MFWTESIHVNVGDVEKGANGHDWLDRGAVLRRGIKVLTKACSPQQSLNAETMNSPGIEAS